MDRNGFEEFVTHSLPALGRYGYVLTGNSGEAEDPDPESPASTAGAENVAAQPVQAAVSSIAQASTK